MGKINYIVVRHRTRKAILAAKARIKAQNAAKPAPAPPPPPPPPPKGS